MGKILGDFPIKVLPERSQVIQENDLAEDLGYVYKKSADEYFTLLKCSTPDCPATITRQTGNWMFSRNRTIHVRGCLSVTSQKYENLWLPLPQTTIRDMFRVSWKSFKVPGGKETIVGANIQDIMGFDYQRDLYNKNIAVKYSCAFPKCPVKMRILENTENYTIKNLQVKIGRNESGLVTLDHLHGGRRINVDIDIRQNLGLPSTTPNSTLIKSQSSSFDASQSLSFRAAHYTSFNRPVSLTSQAENGPYFRAQTLVKDERVLNEPREDIQQALTTNSYVPISSDKVPRASDDGVIIFDGIKYTSRQIQVAPKTSFLTEEFGEPILEGYPGFVSLQLNSHTSAMSSIRETKSDTSSRGVKRPGLESDQVPCKVQSQESGNGVKVSMQAQPCPQSSMNYFMGGGDDEVTDGAFLGDSFDREVIIDVGSNRVFNNTRMKSVSSCPRPSSSLSNQQDSGRNATTCPDSPQTVVSEDFGHRGTIAYEWGKCLEAVLGHLGLEDLQHFNQKIPEFFDSILQVRKEEKKQMGMLLGIPYKSSGIKRFEYKFGWNDDVGAVTFWHEGDIFYKCNWRGTEGCGNLTQNKTSHCSSHQKSLCQVVVIIEDQRSTKSKGVREKVECSNVLLMSRVITLAQPSSLSVSTQDINYLLRSSLTWRAYTQHGVNPICLSPDPKVTVQGVFPLNNSDILTGNLSRQASEMTSCLKTALVGKSWVDPNPATLLHKNLSIEEKSNLNHHYLAALGCPISFYTIETYSVSGKGEPGSLESRELWNQLRVDYRVDRHDFDYQRRNDVKSMCWKTNCIYGSNYGNVFLSKKVFNGTTHIFVGRIHGSPSTNDFEFHEADPRCQDPIGFSSFCKVPCEKETYVLGAYSDETNVLELEALAIFLVTIYASQTKGINFYNTKLPYLGMSSFIIRRARLLFLESLGVVVGFPTTLSLANPMGWENGVLKCMFGKHFVK